MVGTVLESEVEECRELLVDSGYHVLTTEELQRKIAQGRGVSMKLINAILAFILTAEHPKNAAWAVAYAVDSMLCKLTMEQQAGRLGVTKQSISKLAKAFQKANQLPTSRWIRDPKS